MVSIQSSNGYLFTSVFHYLQDNILASVSFWPLLITESVARVSQHMLFTHELLVKQEV